MIIIGDIHGKTYDLIAKIEKYDLQNEILVLLGDCGVGFSHVPEYMDRWSDFNDFLGKRSIMIYIVRGNHDNPRYFDGKSDYTNIIFVPDYSVINIGDKNILFLGGAISIDRSVRLNNRSYWKNEGFVFKPEIVKNIKNVDIVVSHTCPNFAEPISFSSEVDYWHNFEKGMPGNSEINLKEELTKERKDLTYIYNMLKHTNKPKNNIAHWFYSHFHFSGRQVYEGVNFVLLDIDEWYDFKN